MPSNGGGSATRPTFRGTAEERVVVIGEVALAVEAAGWALCCAKPRSYALMTWSLLVHYPDIVAEGFRSMRPGERVRFLPDPSRPGRANCVLRTPRPDIADFQ
jgi:hypothetical protein